MPHILPTSANETTTRRLKITPVFLNAFAQCPFSLSLSKWMSPTYTTSLLIYRCTSGICRFYLLFRCFIWLILVVYPVGHFSCYITVGKRNYHLLFRLLLVVIKQAFTMFRDKYETSQYFPASCITLCHLQGSLTEGMSAQFMWIINVKIPSDPCGLYWKDC